MFIFNDTLVKILTLGIGNYTGITLFPFVIGKKNMRDNKIFINHEKIHLRQQIEMLIVFFYIWYGIEFLIRYVKKSKWNEAYLNICFEKEAYMNQEDENYIKNRKFWNFLKFF